MGSRKRSARARRVAEFKASLAGPDPLADAFGRGAEGRQEALRRKACTSKRRYASRSEAEEVIAARAAEGVRGLRCYRCPHCDGWHLTHRPPEGT